MVAASEDSCEKPYDEKDRPQASKGQPHPVGNSPAVEIVARPLGLVDLPDGRQAEQTRDGVTKDGQDDGEGIGTLRTVTCIRAPLDLLALPPGILRLLV
ncbi:MAG TPA: hypothetical protein PKV96_03765 [Candidatus Saccharimonas sp.]|nr:hypothetical protein [Candidatus Saccharimonas sp.]